MATHFNILAWKIPWTKESGITEVNEHARQERELLSRIN